MSYSILFLVPQAGPVEEIDRFSNAFRFALAIWDKMSEHYLKMPLPLTDMIAMKKVWELANDPNVPYAHRLVLAATFDHAIIEWERLGEMAHAFRQFVTDFLPGDAYNLPAIAAALEKYARSPRQGMAGVCFQATSCGDDLWEVRDEEEEIRPYDITRDSGHWFVFAEIPA